MCPRSSRRHLLPTSWHGRGVAASSPSAKALLVWLVLLLDIAYSEPWWTALRELGAARGGVGLLRPFVSTASRAPGGDRRLRRRPAGRHGRHDRARRRHERLDVRCHGGLDRGCDRPRRDDALELDRLAVLGRRPHGPRRGWAPGRCRRSAALAASRPRGALHPDRRRRGGSVGTAVRRCAGSRDGLRPAACGRRASPRSDRGRCPAKSPGGLLCAARSRRSRLPRRGAARVLRARLRPPAGPPAHLGLVHERPAPLPAALRRIFEARIRHRDREP